MRCSGIAVLLIGSVVLGGCGSGAPQGQTVPSRRPSAVTGPTGTLDVAVREPPSRADTAVRYLRVEDESGRPVLEQELRTAPATFSAPLGAARYRVVTWDRECAGSCQSATDATLGPVTRICGTRVTIVDGVVARVAVDAPSGAECSMTVA